MADVPGAPLRVVIDARLTPGVAGGVEGVVIGLASGLSGLADGPERYSFVAWEGETDWLTPHLSGGSELVTLPRPGSRGGATPPPRGRFVTLRRRVVAAAPWLRTLRRWAAPERPRVTGPRRDPAIEALRPDVVHLPVQRGSLASVPSIFHPHDLQHVHLPQFFSEEVRAWREAWYGAQCRHAAMVAVASEWVARDVREHFGISPDRVRVVPLAPPTAAFVEPAADVIAETRRRLALPDRFILYPAQTWPHKNHRALLEALARLRDADGLTIPLVAPGRQTDFFAELQRRATELGIADAVRWLGFVPSEDLLVLYASADAVVIPSLFEAASGPLWEAFRAGVPAACSNVTSLPEQAGDAALVFDPYDVDDIAHAVRLLWTDGALRRTLAPRGRARVGRYSWDRTARIFRAHYRRLAGRSLSDDDQGLLRIEQVV